MTTPIPLTRLLCAAGCETEVIDPKKRVQIKGRLYCHLCGGEAALVMKFNPYSTREERDKAADVLTVIKLRRNREVRAQREAREAKKAGPDPLCLACGREACAQAGFPGIDREQRGHRCGKEKKP